MSTTAKFKVINRLDLSKYPALGKVLGKAVESSNRVISKVIGMLDGHSDILEYVTDGIDGATYSFKVVLKINDDKDVLDIIEEIKEDIIEFGEDDVKEVSAEIVGDEIRFDVTTNEEV